MAFHLQTQQVKIYYWHSIIQMLLYTGLSVATKLEKKKK